MRETEWRKGEEGGIGAEIEKVIGRERGRQRSYIVSFVRRFGHNDFKGIRLTALEYINTFC